MCFDDFDIGPQCEEYYVDYEMFEFLSENCEN